MAKWIKEGKSENEIIEADAKVRSTVENILSDVCLLYTSPSPRDGHQSRMPSSA